ncbi:hypothetical protein Ddc_19551 [Ditylenchus destructor]|nr:hypothetical protein Ddc_19551 [Ditylenchus destructor]
MLHFCVHSSSNLGQYSRWRSGSSSPQISNYISFANIFESNISLKLSNSTLHIHEASHSNSTVHLNQEMYSNSTVFLNLASNSNSTVNVHSTHHTNSLIELSQAHNGGKNFRHNRTVIHVHANSFCNSHQLERNSSVTIHEAPHRNSTIFVQTLQESKKSNSRHANVTIFLLQANNSSSEIVMLNAAPHNGPENATSSVRFHALGVNISLHLSSISGNHSKISFHEINQSQSFVHFTHLAKGPVNSSVLTFNVHPTKNFTTSTVQLAQI